MTDVIGVFKWAGLVLGGVAVVFVVGIVGFFSLKRRGALRGE